MKTNKKPGIKVIADYYIQANKIILIDEDKKFIAEYSLEEAVKRAKEENASLIQVHNNGEVATCIISDINRYKYSVNKKTKPTPAKKSKEIRITAKSDLTDVLRSLEQCCNFIIEKNLTVTLIIKAYRRSFEGKDSFIINYIEAKPGISCSTQKSPKPNLMKLYVTKKTNKGGSQPT